MKKFAGISLFILAASPIFAAGEPAATESTAALAAAPAEAPAAPLELKNKSSFAIDETSRNPFWPIGWKPSPKQTTATEGIGPEIQPNLFMVSSITVDSGGRYAIINGQVMTEGQVFGLQLGNQTYQITVKAIQDGQVILARRDEEIPVPLRRR